MNTSYFNASSTDFNVVMLEDDASPAFEMSETRQFSPFHTNEHNYQELLDEAKAAKRLAMVKDDFESVV